MTEAIQSNLIADTTTNDQVFRKVSRRLIFFLFILLVVSFVDVRLQMVCDNLSCLGTEALARLGLRLGGFQMMLQSSQFDGVAFDPFSF
jgi:hypothetical protein